MTRPKPDPLALVDCPCDRVESDLLREVAR